MRLLPEGSGQLELLAYAPDGGQIVASVLPGPCVWLWDLHADDVRRIKEPRTPAPLAPLPPEFLAPLAWSPAGDLLAVCGERPVSIRERRTGVERFFLKAAGHQSRCLAFSPDGRTLVSTGVDEDDVGRAITAVILCDVAGGERRKLPASFRVETDVLATSRDASLVLWCEPAARGVPAQLTLWHVPSRRPLARLARTTSPARAAFSPGARQFALAVENVVLHYEIGHVLDYFGMALGSDPWAALTLPFWWNRFVSRLPPLGDAKVLEGHSEAVRALAYAPDGLSLFSGSLDRTVRCWDVASGRQREAWSWPVGAVTALAVAPDGMTAAAGGEDGRAVIWDLTWF
jgi:WD40 repeat protein